MLATAPEMNQVLFGIHMYTLLHTKTYCIAQGTLLNIL